MKTIGERIRALRKAKGYGRQGDLGKMVGVDQSVISDIENGAGFRADVLMALCEHLDTTAEYLMHGAESVDRGEAEILALYRKTSDEGRTSMLAAARGLTASFPRLEKVSQGALGAGVIPEAEKVRTDTLITKNRKRIELPIPGTSKRRGAPSEKHDSHTEPEPPQRGKHAKSAAPARRAGRA